MPPLENNFNKAPSISTKFGELMNSDESVNFPGSKIFCFKQGDKIMRYAIRKNESGELEGSEFELLEYAISSGSDEGYWKSSMSKTDADGKYEVNGKEMPKYKIGPTYQMRKSDLEELQAYLTERGQGI